jgi:hypothetical protein
MDVHFVNYVIVLGILVDCVIRVSMPAFPIPCMRARTHAHTHTWTHIHTHLPYYYPVFEDGLPVLDIVVPNVAVGWLALLLCIHKGAT